MHVSNNSCHGGLLCPHSIWYLYHIIHYHYHPPYPWPLQGNAAAPCIWMFLSNVLLHALSSLTDGFYACCPCGLLISQRPGKAFVDDTAQIQLQSVMWKPEQLEQRGMKRRT